MKLNTVNVIEYVDDTILSIRSFSDGGEGIKEAESLFSELALEYGSTKEAINEGLDDGFMCFDSCTELYICHSS